MSKEEEGNKKGIKRRITQACILCRRKKIKCDGAKPECVHCLDANLQCQYTEYKKRGPHKGYVKLLEDRIVQLETRLIAAGGEVPPPISVNSPQSPYDSPPLQDKLKLPPSLHNNNNNDLPPKEIVTHLVDIFFSNVNNVFPFVNRSRLKQSIEDGTVSKPLLWSVMAISARFSNHPGIKTDPPYWAGERFAQKANDLIDVSILEPSIQNLQFWGIMSCLEYGRASGTKSWTFGGIAVRICQELGLNREETLKKPIVLSDGSIDYVGMALRRRLFWSVLCIDKFSSSSINRAQGFNFGDYNVLYSSPNESGVLRDPLQKYSVEKTVVAVDPLIPFIPKYVNVLEIFGDISKGMRNAKTDSNNIITWPPIENFGELNMELKSWKVSLNDLFKFIPENVTLYKKTAEQNYLNIWLCSHAMYCTGMLALHRGSLAYYDMDPSKLSKDVYERIQSSIQECKENVDMAMDVFIALRDVCGHHILPYMGYCAYIYSTVLMTSAFSSDPVSYRKSNARLSMLFDTIKMLSPYWPMCERLAITTQDLLATHSRLYDVQAQQQYPYISNRINHADTMTSTPMNESNTLNNLPYSTLPHNSNSNTMMTTMGQMQPPQPVLIPQTNQFQQPLNHHQQSNPQQQDRQLQQQFIDSTIDFNSCEFLYDSALFSQMIFDNYTQPSDIKYLPSHYDRYSMALNTSSAVNSNYQQQQAYPLSHQQQPKSNHNNNFSSWRM